MTHEQLPQPETADVVADILDARAQAELVRKGALEVAPHLVLGRTLVDQGLLNPVNTHEEEIAS